LAEAVMIVLCGTRENAGLSARAYNRLLPAPQRRYKDFFMLILAAG
jgi:hypothetical protein